MTEVASPLSAFERHEDAGSSSKGLANGHAHGGSSSGYRTASIGSITSASGSYSPAVDGPEDGINPIFMLGQSIDTSDGSVRITKAKGDRVVIDGQPVLSSSSAAQLPRSMTSEVQAEMAAQAPSKRGRVMRALTPGRKIDESEKMSSQLANFSTARDDDREADSPVLNGSTAPSSVHSELDLRDGAAQVISGNETGAQHILSTSPDSTDNHLTAASPSDDHALDGIDDSHTSHRQKVVSAPPGSITPLLQTTPSTRLAPPMPHARSHSATGVLLGDRHRPHAGSLLGPSPHGRSGSPAPSEVTSSLRKRNTLDGPLRPISPQSVTSASPTSARKFRFSPSRALSFNSEAVASSSDDSEHVRPPMPPANDSNEAKFEDSIAKQAEALRQERLSKRLEKEKAEAEQQKARAQVQRGRSTSRGALVGGEQVQGDRVLVGNLIGEDHVNYILMYNMLTGIRIGVSRCEAKVKRPLTDADYSAKHKFSFDIVGNELTPSAKYDFKFKDYAPWVFRDIREYFRLDPADYLLSLTAKYILSELGSPGKSGSFFYFSRDYRFIIKTIHHTEHKFLRTILKSYHEHLKNNPHTLLSRFYGLHRVKLPRGLNNLFPPHRDIHETYDLKGSSVGREYPEDKAREKPNAVLKDLNWVRRGRRIELGPEKRALFEEQLRRDTVLLQNLGIMDYSLLTGIHYMTRGNAEGLRGKGLTVFQPETQPLPLKRRPTQLRMERENAVSALREAVQRSDPSENVKLPSRELNTAERKLFIFYQDEGGLMATDDSNQGLDVVYYLGIIDILTPYNWVKRGEHFWKGLSQDKDRISAIPPRPYGDRFLNFMRCAGRCFTGAELYRSIIRGGDPSIRPKME